MFNSEGQPEKSSLEMDMEPPTETRGTIYKIHYTELFSSILVPNIKKENYLILWCCFWNQNAGQTSSVWSLMEKVIHSCMAQYTMAKIEYCKYIGKLQIIT